MSLNEGIGFFYRAIADIGFTFALVYFLIVGVREFLRRLRVEEHLRSDMKLRPEEIARLSAPRRHLDNQVQDFRRRDE